MNNVNLNEKELLKLQKQYRSGMIKEEELSNEEIEALTNLYKKQIEYIEFLIGQDKEKIVTMRRNNNI